MRARARGGGAAAAERGRGAFALTERSPTHRRAAVDDAAPTRDTASAAAVAVPLAGGAAEPSMRTLMSTYYSEPAACAAAAAVERRVAGSTHIARPPPFPCPAARAPVPNAADVQVALLRQRCARTARRACSLLSFGHMHTRTCPRPRPPHAQTAPTPPRMRAFPAAASSASPLTATSLSGTSRTRCRRARVAAAAVPAASAANRARCLSRADPVHRTSKEWPALASALTLLLPCSLSCCPSSASLSMQQTWTELAADLSRRVPSKIDIGPVYSHDPRQRAKYARGETPSKRARNAGRPAHRGGLAANARARVRAALPACPSAADVPTRLQLRAGARRVPARLP